jgi:hypothetical protein
MAKDTSAEDVASWLGRETGHSPDSTDGYSEDEATEGEEPRSLGLPNANHEKLRQFFDGLHIEKSLTEKRRADALAPLDEADQMNEALKGAISKGPIQ